MGLRLRRAWTVPFGVLACALLIASSALAQDPRSQPPPGSSEAPPANPPASAPAPNSGFRPGLVEALGRLFDDSKAKLDEHIKGTQQTIGGIGSQATEAVKDAAGAAKEATGAIVGLPGTGIVTGREICPLAPNGAPDCTPAALALCKSKGYGGGRGLDINSVHKCPRRAWLSGRMPEMRDCRVETFVTRAFCQ
jgi:hypothetical protein